MNSNSQFKLDTPTLSITASIAPWDTKALNVPSAVITKFKILSRSNSNCDFGLFWNWVSTNNIKFVSARLADTSVEECLFLEQQGFNIIEMVLHPCLPDTTKVSFKPYSVEIEVATLNDLNEITEGARNSFGSERFHSDPRISKQSADGRYANWVGTAICTGSSSVVKIIKDTETIGFFQYREDNRDIYWELTAVFPKFQGLGLGFQVWLSMIHFHSARKSKSITTTISARNTRILNLYSKLQFHFLAPEFSLHWLAS